MDEFIYLDNNATTQPLPEVISAMADVQRDAYANPSSVHRFAQQARHLVERSRRNVAELIHARADEIVFTSGGTESVNLAIRGLLAARPKHRRFVTTTVEHSCVLEVARRLAREGFEVECVGVNCEGRLDEEHLDRALSENTGLLSIMHANNETGVIFDVQRICALARGRGVPVHVDAAQTVGKIDVNVQPWGAHLVSFSAHKFHGPKGVGALYVRQPSRLAPQILGGPQEREMRGGTENVEGIVGMGVAATIAVKHFDQTAAYVESLRDRLEAGVLETIPSTRVHGIGAPRMYNTSSLGFARLDAEAVLILLSEAGVCASSGSACSSGSLEPSHVLRAMGVDPEQARGAIRLSFSRFNRPEDVDRVLAMLPGLLSRLTVSGAR